MRMESVCVFRQHPCQQQHGPGWVALCFCLCRLDLFLRDRQQQQESSLSYSRTSHFLPWLAFWISLVCLVYSLLRYDGKQDTPSLCIGTIIWPLPFAGCALSARCMRAACASRARVMRASCAGHSPSAPATRCALVDFFLPRALCMRYACALHTSSAPATRCACVVNSLASSEFWQKFDAQRRTGHIFHFSLRGPCVALVWLGLNVGYDGSKLGWAIVRCAVTFAVLKAKLVTISSHTHQLQFIQLHHFKLERFKSI